MLLILNQLWTRISDVWTWISDPRRVNRELVIPTAAHADSARLLCATLPSPLHSKRKSSRPGLVRGQYYHAISASRASVWQDNGPGPHYVPPFCFDDYGGMDPLRVRAASSSPGPSLSCLLSPLPSAIEFLQLAKGACPVIAVIPSS